MKILIINDYTSEFGGAEKVVYDNIKLLKEAGHEVEFIGGKQKPMIPLLWGWFSWKYFIKTILTVSKFKPNVIHVHSCIRNISISPLVATKIFRLPIIMTVHDYNLVCPKLWMINSNNQPCNYGISCHCITDNCINSKMGYKWFPYHFFRLIKLLFQRFAIKRLVDIFISPSNDLCNKILKSFDTEKVVYIPNYINTVSVINKKKVDKKYFLYVGRLSKEKGVDNLIKTFVKLKNEKLLIVGDGPEMNYLKSITTVNNITFTGKVDHEELVKYYKQAFALIVPSIWMENNPLVVLESLYWGTPVISTNRGGLSDFSKNGAMCLNYNNSKELIECIKRIKLSKVKVDLPYTYSAQNFLQKISKCYLDLILQ